jgi:NAD(P)-dependent dehydrogenase (short-subunit alcohol dehydrogenase family)
MAAVFKQQPIPAYNISKAALDMLIFQYALVLKDAGFNVLAICPGVSRVVHSAL